MGLAARRMRAHLALFAALFGVVAVITGFSTGIAGYVATASVAGVRDGFAAATGSDGSLRADVRLGGADQDAAVRSLVAEQFGDAPMLVERTLESDAVTVGTPDGEAELVLASAAVEPRATLDAGAWASDGDEAVLGVEAAASLGLAPGDLIVLPGGAGVTVTGTWSASDPLDPYWFGEDTSGLLIVDESVFGQTDVVPFARWTIHPDAAAIEPGQLDGVSSGAADLREALEADEAVGTGNIVISGGLAGWTERLRSSLGAVSGVVPVPAILAAVIGIIALVELARLLVGVRVIETGLLRSRGASALRLTRDAAAEAAIAAVPGAIVGTVGAALLVGSWSWPIPVLVVAAAVVAFALTTFVDARRPASRETAQDSGRGRRLAGGGLLVLVVVGAIVSAWQFRLYGSAVVRGADGRSAVDPIAVLAPALVLVAAALLGVLLFGMAARGLERTVRRRGSFGWALAARQVSRRSAVFTTPVLLIALASGGLMLAAAYSATWEQATRTALEVGNGADVRVITTERAVAFEGDGAAVLTAAVQLGDDPVALVAFDDRAAEGVVTSASGAIDTERLATGLRTDTPGIAVPDGTAELVVSATAPTDLWLADGDGALVLMRAGNAELPPGEGWRILAADVPIVAPESPYRFEIESITADGESLELGDWQLAPDAWPLEGEAELDGAGFVATLDIPRAGTVRLLPAGEAQVPLVISQSLADRGSLAPGDELTLRFEGSGRQLVGTITDVIPAVPGTSNGLAVVADLTALDRQQLLAYGTVPRVNEVWISTDDPSAIAGPRVTTTEARDTLLAAGRGALWIGSIGGLVLALAAVSAIAGALLRGRSGELVVLRVVGLSAREQASSRRRELLVVVLYSLVAGLLAGTLTSLLLVPGLARSTVLDPPQALATVLAVDPLWGGIALAAFVAALLAVVGVYSARVLRQARTLSVREDVR